MKKLFILIVTILILLPVPAQEHIIDMDSFKNYLSEYSLAKNKKDETKLKELAAERGRKYDRKAILERVIKSHHHGYYDDREACAYLAAYYEADYYQNWKEIDLENAVKYYEAALSHPVNMAEEKEAVAQVKLHYARFLIQLSESSSIYSSIDELVKMGGLEKTYHSYIKEKDIVRTDEELRVLLKNKIARLIQDSGDGGYDVGAYYWARILRQYSVPAAYRYPFIQEGGLLDGRWVLMDYYKKGHYEKLKQCGDADYPLRNEDVVRYYTIAATGGRPQFQMELAEYLLRTICRKLNAPGTSFPGSYKNPFIYEYKEWVFDGYRFVQNWYSDVEIEEQLMYWYLQAAKQDFTPAMVDLAFCIFYQMHPYDDDSLHYSEIEHWLERASSLGDATAMYNLSVLKLAGDGRAKQHQDSIDAFSWAQKGAGMGDFKCQHMLGRYYYYGIGVRSDKHEALKWFRAAADNGSKGAAYMAGNLYADETVGNDMTLAVMYYESAEEIPEAYLRLSELYDKGKGVVMDKQKAHEYRRKAGGGAFLVGADLSDYSYGAFVPGPCFYSYSNYDGWKTEPSLLKPHQL